jgi:hypothetical protein
MPVIQRIRYLAFKWEALALLVFGRKAAAAAVFDRMLAEFPRDAYAMASKAHLLVQSGDRGQALQLRPRPELHLLRLAVQLLGGLLPRVRWSSMC